MSQRLKVTESQRSRCCALTWMDGENAATDHFGDIGGVSDDYGDRAEHKDAIGHSFQAQSRNSETDQQDDQEHGDAPEEIDISGSKDSKRHQSWRTRGANQRDGESQDRN